MSKLAGDFSRGLREGTPWEDLRRGLPAMLVALAVALILGELGAPGFVGFLLRGCSP